MTNDACRPLRPLLERQSTRASIADQLRSCRLHAERQGWTIVAEYSDHAVSGASMIRVGVQALLGDALRRRFDVVLTELLDRLSRDQEDIAGFYKRTSSPASRS